ncbi:hypothetical protein BGZ58_000718 [Dissophora ornata]|nr:hypothetical protein BGZ58_000718 [Dissophora ornata]
MKIQSAYALTALIAGITTVAEGLSLPLAKDFSLQQQHYYQLDTQTVVRDELTAAREEGLAVSVDRTWQVLGPFPTGMREQDFGADPLEAFGGFRSLSYDAEANYPSELAKDGIVRWHTTDMDNEGWIHVLYPEVE